MHLFNITLLSFLQFSAYYFFVIILKKLNETKNTHDDKYKKIDQIKLLSHVRQCSTLNNLRKKLRVTISNSHYPFKFGHFSDLSRTSEGNGIYFDLSRFSTNLGSTVYIYDKLFDF